MELRVASLNEPFLFFYFFIFIFVFCVFGIFLVLVCCLVEFVVAAQAARVGRCALFGGV